MSAPREFSVSVIIPTLNRERFVGDAIRSALDQSEPVTEILVIDGGSTDGTRRIAESFGERIRFMMQEGQWISGARNTGIRVARGNWIAFLDSDDVWLPDKLKRQKEFLFQHPGLELVFGDMAVVEESESHLKPEILDDRVHAVLRARPAKLDDILQLLLKLNFIPTSSVLFAKDCVKRVGLMDERVRACEDYDFWLRFALCCRMGFVDAILVKRRIHDGNAIRNAYLQMYESVLGILQRFGPALSSQGPEIKEAYECALAKTEYRLGSYHFKHRDFVNASKMFSEMSRQKHLPCGMDFVKFTAKSFLAATLSRRVRKSPLGTSP